jgi:hypothetical protein
VYWPMMETTIDTMGKEKYTETWVYETGGN